ncbi:unnamed protein product [Chondrus crispus]|uniref:Uncharacterized protein n=1 Tax=Chondrus crispus TaxID=2769 RepID=R7QMI6_CHOCR|nr:unnamed protein product [Chondrus crispus]CDF38590.1 unnamed protein product [Chondrus crispus]|eukprot:XP_005718495.1 unnamed protein product [Chondrus crispus]
MDNTTLLTKRSRPDAPAVLDPRSKRHQSSSPSAHHVAELCALLLEKVGVNVSATTDVHALNKIISAEYSPRVVELLHSIASTAPKSHPLDAASDLTETSDEEDFDAVVPFDALLPTRPPRTRTLKSDAVVPASPVHTVPSLAPRPIVVHPPTPAAPKVLPSAPPTTAAAYKKETEIAISRIFDLGKTASVLNPHIPATAPYHGPSVVTMTGFGELGRFGNQLMQYMFLKCYAENNAISEIQVPAWVGAGLFGLTDRPVQRALPAVVEFKGTLANSTFTDDFIDYVKNSRTGTHVAELTPDSLDGPNLDSPRNVDIWGWFQWHTSYFANFKPLIQRTFAPVPALKAHCEFVFENNLRFRNGVKHTVVGLHLRLGDYQNIAASSFGYCAPTTWYLEWLEKIWPTLDNPILFVASDDLGSVLRDFAAYNPVTADDIGLQVPSDMKHLKAGFFPDWWSLTQCDVLAISNSTFSFSACMMNQQPGARFYRAHFKDRIIPVDPWNADVIVHRDMRKAGFSAALETLQVVYNTQGSSGLARNLLYELPYYGIRAAVMKAVLWRQANRNAVRAVA